MYNVKDEEGLALLAKEEGLKLGNLKQLIGLQKNSGGTTPQHKAGWQVLERVWWIQREECAFGPACGPFPFVTANGLEWVQMYALVHNDAHLQGTRLQRLAHTGTVPIGNGRGRAPTYRGWRKVQAPDDPVGRGLVCAKPPPSPFACTKVSPHPLKDFLGPQMCFCPSGLHEYTLV